MPPPLLRCEDLPSTTARLAGFVPPRHGVFPPVGAAALEGEIKEEAMAEGRRRGTFAFKGSGTWPHGIAPRFPSQGRRTKKAGPICVGPAGCMPQVDQNV